MTKMKAVFLNVKFLYYSLQMTFHLEMNMRRVLNQMKIVAAHMRYCAEVKARMLFSRFSQGTLEYPSKEKDE